MGMTHSPRIIAAAIHAHSPIVPFAIQRVEGMIALKEQTMPRKLKAKVCWPDLRTPPESWSDAEVRAVCINPIVTGIGRHPRSISDEDWVLSCERDIEINGLAQFLTDLLHILRLTIPKYLGEPQPVGEYPQRKSEGEVPLPSVSYQGDRDWNKEGWNEGMVGGILCNPVYAGIPPFEAVVDEPTWIRAGVRMVESIGLRQYLVNVLYQLKKSVSGGAVEE
jgi:hypothetical protein